MINKILNKILKFAPFPPNENWVDCNRCGAIIHKSKIECIKGGAKHEIPEVCYVWGMVCKNCFELYKKSEFDLIKFFLGSLILKTENKNDWFKRFKLWEAEDKDKNKIAYFVENNLKELQEFFQK